MNAATLTVLSLVALAAAASWTAWLLCERRRAAALRAAGDAHAQRLQLAVDDLDDLYQHAPCAYYSLDADGRFLEANRTALQWFECDDDTLVGRLSPKDFFAPREAAAFDANFARFRASGRMDPVERELIGRAGTRRRVGITATAVLGADGRFLRSRSMMHDITEQHAARCQLETLNAELRLMLDSDLVGLVRLKNRVAVWKNHALDAMFGWEAGGLDGQPARCLFPDDASCERIGREASPVIASGARYRTQVELVRRDGSPVWVDLSGVLLSRETGESLWMMLDIGAMKRQQAQVEHAAFHDALTGLPNRLLLLDRLRQALAVDARGGGLLAACFIDLDGFKAVNDSRGHAAGDRLLKVVAERLLGQLRGHDTVARLGGDEFVLLLTRLHHEAEAKAVLDRVLHALAEPVPLPGGGDGHVSASVGVAFARAGDTSAERLLDAADHAMYAAKRDGRNRVRVAAGAVAAAAQVPQNVR
jgi:diguanylate cyclase (GGDEF)-like protein/PAS domain S-box-containing protein